MTDMNEVDESPATTLCKSCGLCCSGHLFAWVRLNANELDRSAALGLNVIRDDPRQRGFTQPCPLWNGICTVYTSPDYPHSCGTYKCTTLRKLLDENIQLPEALTVIQETLQMIRELETYLPGSSTISFRERLIAHKEHLEETEEGKLETKAREFLHKVDELLHCYEDRFGVDDFIDYDV